MFKSTKQIIVLIGFLYPLFCVAQKKKILINGKISDSITVVKNVNIVNLQTKQVTYSNDNGLYKIYASKGDTLSFTSIQHKTKQLVINEKIILLNEVNITLLPIIYTLDEFTLQKNNLKGILQIDLTKVPKHQKEAILKKNTDFSNIDFSQIDTRIDENIRAKPTITIVDPNQKFEGLNLKKILFSIKKKPYKPITKNNFDKNKVPNKVLIELGEDYFFKTLKIPKQKYHHFLEFCNLITVINLYKKRETLTLIQLFQDKSKIYLKSNKN